MTDRDIAALESFQLVPRLLHNVERPNTLCSLLGGERSTPIVPLVEAGGVGLGIPTLSLIDADMLLAHRDSVDFRHVVPLLKCDKMGVLMPQVRKLAALGSPGFALDLTVLADTPPYGARGWRPKSREELAELRAAAGLPLWLYGVGSVADANVATEAGLEGIVVNTDAALYLGGPATIDIFPDIFDAVAGTIAVYAGGPVRSGLDVFRYLAVGAEAVIVDSDRALANVQAELEYAMRLTGCETLADIGYEAVFAPLFGEAP